METGRHIISFEEYLADPCPEPSLTRSTIKSLISESPLKAFYGHSRLNKNYKKKEKTIFDIGTAAHALLLDGVNSIQVCDYDDWRTKKAQEEKDEAIRQGKIALLPPQASAVEEMVMVAHKKLSEFEIRGEKKNLKISDGDSELTYIWEVNGVWCRIRPDWIGKDRRIIIDYKTTGELALPDNYANIIANNGLDIQASFYCHGVNHIEREDPDFYFLVQETEEPYECALFELDAMFRDMGFEKVSKAIRLWKKCLTENYWPGYTNQLQVIEPKPWALATWEMRKSTILAEVA